LKRCKQAACNAEQNVAGFRKNDQIVTFQFCIKTHNKNNGGKNARCRKTYAVIAPLLSIAAIKYG